jgi:excisionase family DNA binding protein
VKFRASEVVEGHAMPEIQTGQSEEVLTLAEAASYLRVPEADLLRLVENHDIPAQKIGGEWRLLKKALTEWLRYGRDYFREVRRWPWMFDHPMLEELLLLLEGRLLKTLSAEKPVTEPGSKQAVLKHFGIFKDEDDLEEVLAGIRARRKAAGG